jgi:hypothetical protein
LGTQKWVTTKIMDWGEKTLRNKRIPLVRVLWRNSQIEGGGEFYIFPSSNLRINTQISIPAQALELLSGGNTFGWRINKKKSEELVKKRGRRVAGYMQGEEG